MKTMVVALAMGAAWISVVPASATAQGAPALRVHAFAGLLDGRGGVPNAPVLADRSAVLSYADFGAGPAAGVALEARVGPLPVGLRVGLTRSLAVEETGVWGCGVDASGNPLPCPSILIEVPTDVTTSIATFALVGDLPAGLLTLHPSVGAAVQRWSYDWDPSPVGSFSLEPGTFTDDAAALHLGLAISAAVRRLRLEAGYGEYHAKRERARPGRTGVVTVGASIGLS